MGHIKQNLKNPILLLGVAYFAYLCWAVWPFLYLKSVGYNGGKDITMKEIYESLGTLVAILGVIFVGLTLILQWLHLKTTQSEIQKQDAVRERQNFESTLYRLIDYHRQMVDGIVLTYNEEEYKAEQAIFLVWNSIGNEMKVAADFQEMTGERLSSIVFSELTSDQSNVATRYVDSIHLILKLIDQRGNPDDQLFYLAVFRQVLSENGRRIVAVLALNPQYTNLKWMMEKYGFLGNLEFDGVDPNDWLFKAYDPNAFNHTMATYPFASRKLPTFS